MKTKSTNINKMNYFNSNEYNNNENKNIEKKWNLGNSLDILKVKLVESIMRKKNESSKYKISKDIFNKISTIDMEIVFIVAYHNIYMAIKKYNIIRNKV